MDTRAQFPPFRGEGPGPQTADGCSVELYLRLPYRDPIGLDKWIEGPRLLELGCGVGRMTRHLLAHGFDVTAVDNSPEMLAHVHAQAMRICSNIEELSLDARFDTVILASCLINTPNVDLRSALVAGCGAHLRRGGRLLFERHDPSWLATAAVGPVGPVGDVEIRIDRLERSSDHVQMSVRYRAGSMEWLHHFAAAALDDEQVETHLVEGGFDAPQWINRRWAYAVKAGVGRT